MRPNFFIVRKDFHKLKTNVTRTLACPPVRLFFETGFLRYDVIFYSFRDSEYVMTVCGNVEQPSFFDGTDRRFDLGVGSF